MEDTAPRQRIEAAPRAAVEELVHKSYTARDPHAALDYAQRAADFRPDDPSVQDSVQRSLLAQLERDAFVAFVEENEKHYVVHLRNSRPISVPKARAAPETYPAPAQSEGERLLGALRWMALGLLPVGLGAVLLWPILAGRALGLLGRPGLSVRERRLAWLAVGLLNLFGCAGAFFAFLLLLRLVG